MQALHGSGDRIGNQFHEIANLDGLVTNLHESLLRDGAGSCQDLDTCTSGFFENSPWPAAGQAADREGLFTPPVSAQDWANIAIPDHLLQRRSRDRLHKATWLVEDIVETAETVAIEDGDGLVELLLRNPFPCVSRRSRY